MAMIETWFSQDLNEPVQVQQLDGNVFSQDNQGNLIGVNVFDGGAPATLSGTVSANVIRADGATVAVAGVLTGNSCYIIMPSAAYAVPGIISVVIKLTGGGSTTTLCAVVANVYQSATDATVDPGTIMPSIQDLIDAIDEAVASIPPDYSATVNALTAKYGISSSYYIQHNKDTHIITFPGGFYTFAGNSKGVGAQTLDISSVLSSNACNLWIDANGVISAGAWNGNAKPNCELLGYVFNEQLVVNGVPFTQIKTVDSAGSLIPGTFYSPAIIGTNHYDNIVYNYTTKILTIPPAFTSYKGYGWARGSVLTLDVSSILVNDACVLYVRENGSIYAVAWNGCKAGNQKDQAVGYIFRKQVVIFGVNPSQISVIDESTDKVLCFGDSITAGVGASSLYHMILHEINPNLMFYNWGVGSTGYVLEWTGTAVVGGGVVGDGTSQSVSGNNNILKVMQGVTGAMPNICIFSGTNDFGNNIPLSEFTTAVQNALDYALTKTAKIFVITPIKRNGWETANGLGLYLKDYADVIKAECESRGIVCFDGFDVCIDPSISSVRTAFAPDGLHPNDAGQHRLARAINAKILEAFAR